MKCACVQFRHLLPGSYHSGTWLFPAPLEPTPRYIRAARRCCLQGIQHSLRCKERLSLPSPFKTAQRLVSLVTGPHRIEGNFPSLFRLLFFYFHLPLVFIVSYHIIILSFLTCTFWFFSLVIRRRRSDPKITLQNVSRNFRSPVTFFMHFLKFLWGSSHSSVMPVYLYFCYTTVVDTIVVDRLSQHGTIDTVAEQLSTIWTDNITGSPSNCMWNVFTP